MGNLQGLIARGIAEEGYIEKKSNAELDSKNGNRGSNNYTKYSRDVNKWGLNGCQGQPWCCTMQFALEGYEYGPETALKHWHMTRESYVGYNCFSTYNTFKKAGKVGMIPQLGAVVIFNFSHAGRVIKIYSKNGEKWWECLEGNTSSNLSERNGGQVKIKTRPWNDASVKGFCYIDYPEQKTGWIENECGWWYRHEDGSYTRNGWEPIGGKWYWFNGDGYAYRCQWVQDKGRWYYLGADNAMVTGFQAINGEVFYFDASGAMAAKRTTIEIVPDERGALH